MIRLFLFSLLLASLCSIGCARKEEKTCAVYGFSRDLEIFKDMTSTQIANRLSEWNINAVFGGYWDSSMVRALHDRDIRVFAEVGFFTGSEARWEEAPELRPVNSQGKPISKDEWYCGISPTIEWFRDKKIDVVKKTLENYDVDGIWLDFIRWPCHWEVLEPRIEQTSFDSVSLSAFENDTRIHIPEDFQTPEERAAWILAHHLDTWTRWKCDVITEYVCELRRVVKSYGSDKILGLFGVPWRDSDFDGAITKVVGQDYRELGRLVDVLSPMVYHRMCGKDIRWIGEITSYVHEKGGGKPVWPVIQAMGDSSKSLNAHEFGQAMTTALNAVGSEGLIIFTLAEAIEESKRNEMIHVFSSIAGR